MDPSQIEGDCDVVWIVQVTAVKAARVIDGMGELEGSRPRCVWCSFRHVWIDVLYSGTFETHCFINKSGVDRKGFGEETQYSYTPNLTKVLKRHRFWSHWKPTLLCRETDRRITWSVWLEFSLPLLLAVASSSFPVASADVASVTDVALRLLRSR